MSNMYLWITTKVKGCYRNNAHDGYKWTGVRPFCSFIRKTDGGECAKGDL